MGKTAREEGYPELTEWFETLTKAEKSHAGCACGSSGAAACGPGGLTAWERGRRGRGREGAEGVDVDYAPVCLHAQAAASESRA
jgi:hypothetical protein